MSFILDAIKKSEDERQRSKGPDVYSLQSGAARRGPPAPAWARVLLLLLAITLLLFIASWLWPRLQDQFGAARKPAAHHTAGQTQATQAPQQQSNQQQTSQQPLQQQAGTQNRDSYQDQPASGGLTPPVVRAGQAGQSAGATDASPAREFQAGSGLRVYASDDPLPPRHLIKELWELPADYQSTVPDLKFSFHVFSKAPDKRTIIINGRRLREGQMITSQMRLRSITDTGVICHYRGQFFHVDVVEKW